MVDDGVEKRQVTMRDKLFDVVHYYEGPMRDNEKMMGYRAKRVYITLTRGGSIDHRS